MKFSFVDVITLVGIIQGFLIAVVLFRLNKSNKSANRALAVALVVASLVLFGRMIIVHDFAMHIFKWLSFTDSIIFLFGPLTYLYVRRLLVETTKPFSLSFYHYFPAITYVIIFIFFRAQNETQTRWLYEQGYMYWFFNSFEFVGLISNFYYLFRCYRLLFFYKTQEMKLLSYRQEVFQFLTIYLTTITFCIFLWLFSYINAYYLRNYFTYINYNNIWFTIPLFIYVVGYYSLKQPEIFRLSLFLPKKQVALRLSKFEINRLKNELNSLIEDKIYLKSTLMLREVAEAIGSSPNDVSWLLNNHYDCNFFDFINGHRVKHFVKAIENNEHQNTTILGLAMDAGFNSKSAFNRGFKKHMNCTPSNYIKKLNNHIQVA